MQNAKRSSCRNDTAQAIDGSITNHISTDENASQGNTANGNDTQVLSDDDDDELFNWYVIFISFAYTQSSDSDLVFIKIVGKKQRRICAKLK